MKPKKSTQKHTVRIIAGEWRHRRLPVADVPGLRPTGDRLRETLFNWLQAVVPGSRCLDLFAGTGVLGLEAASRGAARVTLVELDRRAAESLRQVIATLGNGRIAVEERDALAMLAAECPDPYDLVFVDPPFEEHWCQGVVDALHKGGWVPPGGRVYVESALREPEPVPPEGWEVLRNKEMGEVRAQLFGVAT